MLNDIPELDMDKLAEQINSPINDSAGSIVQLEDARAIESAIHVSPPN